MASSTKVFVSYSWDDENHKAWVSRLAADLRRDGVETRLDIWHVELGDPLAVFMEREIRDNDYVVIVCTPEYRHKSDAGKGGVGFEGAIMTSELAELGNHRKYIPILARGTWREAAPAWLRGKRYADLSTAERYAQGYDELLRTLQGGRLGPPAVGSAGAGGASANQAGTAGGETWGVDKDPVNQRQSGEKAAGDGWHGSKAVAGYTIAALVIAGLTLLYGEGLLRQPESASEVVKLADDDEEKVATTVPQAKVRPAGTVFRDCADCPVMVVVPAGSFTMGAPVHEEGSYPNERPLHRVTLAESLAVGVYEVTRGEFRRFVEELEYKPERGCWIEDSKNRVWQLSMGHGWRNVGFSQTDLHPVSCVSWQDAQEYVRWLSEKSDEEYRLLSESEWEYVARGGTSAGRYWEDGDGNGTSDQCRYANGADMSTVFPWRVDCSDRYEYTAPVGSYEANAFGVHDVLGNVWEWVQDCWRDGYLVGPNGASAWEGSGCELRVLRGGSRYVGPAGIRSAHRFKYEPDTRNQNTGFRIGRSL
ncbi:MAG: SUMF1/EgtB/PvdO family nonheme iron enzyme [Gammaproteobacteria bacterium]|nr:SUMF1/EgtB/PvdO family nonheme iron enzyme [Gammaproteobacteria bacterium]MYE52020.1 SUMF1/EgtB/PvdO family nonheme iron enzyme [Gammaproteobacteria bacterium]